MASKKILLLSKKLNDLGFNVMQNKQNGIICKGFYIYDKKGFFRIFNNINYIDLSSINSIVDLIKNNGCL